RFVPPRYAVHHFRFEFSLQSASVDHGGDDALASPALTALARDGARATKDHEVHALDVSLHFVQLFRGLDPLLDCAKLAHYRSNEADAGQGGKDRTSWAKASCRA